MYSNNIQNFKESGNLSYALLKLNYWTSFGGEEYDALNFESWVQIQNDEASFPLEFLIYNGNS